VGENGTIYCCWLFTVNECEDEKTFRDIVLASEILSLMGCIIVSCFTSWIYFDKNVIGTKKFVSSFLMIDVGLILFFIHDFSLYANAYHNSPYGYLALFFSGTFLSLAIFSFVIEMLSLQRELNARGEHWIIKLKHPAIVWSILAMMIEVAISVVFCHFVNLDAEVAEMAFQAQMYFADAHLLILSIAYCVVIEQVLRKVAADAHPERFFIAKGRIEHAQFISVFFLIVFLGIMGMLASMDAVQEIFKIRLLSVFFCCLVYICTPVLCVACAISVSIYEHDKKPMIRLQIPNSSEPSAGNIQIVNVALN